MRSPRIFIGAITLSSLLLLTVFRLEGANGEGEASTEACRSKTVTELGNVHDEFRAHVFGARDGIVLTGGSMDDEQTIPGILETKGRLTSELIEPVIESYRVLRCRSIAVCKAMEQSFPGNGGVPLTIDTLGCAPQLIESYGECSLNSEQDPAMSSNVPELIGECGRLVEKSLKAERAVLTLAFSYDSGYRAALQLGGMIDWMKEDAPTKLLEPIRGMVNMLGKLHEIPCFIGQCDNPDTSGLSSSASSSS